ncbi:MAG TPA: translation elongation factor Ts [Candidatus Krumholzibacteria bacterium]|nr:translation elongation factor Ts [Candidatus Krumholzibacteria bacterium]
MADISAGVVRELRDKTGAGMMDCKKALAESDGDLEKAVDYLRTKGLAGAAKKAGRATQEGLIFAYIHSGSRVGVMVEVNCESDFVARTPDFVELCKDLAMQVAATNPVSVRREEFDPELLERELGIFRGQAAESGKPAPIVEKMVQGRVEKLYKERVLLEQPFVKDPDRSVEERVKAAIAKLGENIVVRRFVRYQLGEEA